MAQIQIGFCTVFGHIDFAVLIGTHGAGIDIDIGVELLSGDFEAAGFEQSSQRGSGDAFAQPGNNTASHKNIFGHLI